MSTKDTLFTQEELIIIAENSGIKEPDKMSTSDLIKTLTRHEKKRVSHNPTILIKYKIHQKATCTKQER